MHPAQWVGRLPGYERITDGKMESLRQLDSGRGSDPLSQIWDLAAYISRSPDSQTNIFVHCLEAKSSLGLLLL